MSKFFIWIFSAVLMTGSALGASASSPMLEKQHAKAVTESAAAALARPADSETPEKGPRKISHVKARKHVTKASERFASPLRSMKRPAKKPVRVATANEGGYPTLWGSLIFSGDWDLSGDTPYGLYSVPTSENETFGMLMEKVDATYGGVLVGDTYYWCEIDYAPVTSEVMASFYGIDMESGQLVFNSGNTGKDFTWSMTYDHTTKTIYAVMSINRIQNLVKLSFDNGYKCTVIAPFAGEFDVDLNEFNSIACGKDGQLYGITYDYDPDTYEVAGSSLCRIDKTDGTVSRVGATGQVPLYTSDSTIDPQSGRMFWTIADDYSGYLCEVNLTTGAATPVYDFPNAEEVCGLVIPAPEAEAGAPAEVQDASAAFNGGSLSGIISFTAPTTLFDGTAATGSLTYSIKANGEEVASGSTSCGAKVSAPVTLEEPGLYTFTITVANAIGVSPSVKLHNVYVGNDTPAAPAPALEYKDGNMNLTWEPVKASVNGGYLDADAVTYTVKRFAGDSDGVVVAWNRTKASFSEPIELPSTMTQYHYEVTATCNSMTSAAGKSNVVTIGALVPPYTANFTDEFAAYTVINANNDGSVWELSNGSVRIPYNVDIPMDDWLITPPIQLKRGQLYDFVSHVSANNVKNPEKIEIKFGKEPTAEAMTSVLMEPTVVTSPKDEPFEYRTALIPEESGVYHIGFHAISDPDSYYLWVHDLSIAAGRAASVPVPGELTVTPGRLGALTASVLYTVPTKGMDDSELTSLYSAVLSRNGEVIKTWSNPVPGAQLTYEDVLETGGDYTYSVTCSNASGDGVPATAKIYVGVNYPSAITGLKWTETSNPGEVTISWDAVTTDISGNTLEPSQVTYQIFTFDNESNLVPLTEKISENSYTYQAVPAGKQQFLQYAVMAYTEMGEGQGAISNYDPAGTPYEGMTFSAYDDFDRYALSTDDEGGASWGVYSDDIFENITSVDNDNMFFGMYSQYLNRYADILTGYITLANMPNPAVSFYMYNAELQAGAENINEIAVSVREKGQTEWTELKKVTAKDVAPLECWGKVLAGLDAYAGKTIQVKLTGTACKASYTYADCLRIGSLVQNDLSVTSMAAPAKVNLGSDYTVSATVLNEGSKDAGAFTVELYADDNLVKTNNYTSLAAGESMKADFTLNMSGLTTDPIEYYAKVVFAADENMENNTGDVVEVAPILPAYPVVTDLNGTVKGESVELTWSVPDLSKAPGEAVTHDFEDGEGFVDEYGDWTFLDIDGIPVGGFSGLEIPNIVSGSTPGSFWVWDCSQIANSTFAAHSGDKYLFSLYNGMEVDDWAISPELDGSAQTISFYARSYSSEYFEEIEVLYSMDTMEPEDFIQVKGVGGLVSNEWTLYEAELPEGALYFAIRSHSVDKLMLMIDDVTFIPEGAKHNLEIKGYNVYRNGEKITETPITANAYTDANVKQDENYSYKVTVSYNKGESAASNEYKTGDSGVGSVDAGAVRIGVDGRNIVVAGAAGLDINVFTVDGKLVNSVVGEALTTIPSAQGVYLVKVGNKIGKVMVK